MDFDKGTNEDLYTDEDVADPELKDVPDPLGWRVIVRPLPPRTKIGSILLADTTREEESIVQCLGRVIKIGPLAWTRSDMGEEPWAAVGDTVIYGKYAGRRFSVNGVKMLLLNDDDLIAKVHNPQAIGR